MVFGPDISILVGPLSKAESDSAFDKGLARIETSGTQLFGYLHFGHLVSKQLMQFATFLHISYQNI